MLFDRLGHRWAELKDRLSHLRALVVDDDEIVRDLVTEILKTEGFEVERCGDAATALERLKEKPFDLLVTDKNLPEKNGLELIAEVKAAGLDVPAALITGYASIPSIAEAFEHGAADYIAKPFEDVAHVARRLKSIAERGVAEQLYARIIADLKSAVASSGADRRELEELARELAAAKAALWRRPELLVVDPDTVRGPHRAEELEQRGLTVELATPTQATERLQGPGAPLVALISLDLPSPAMFVFEARAAEPLTEIIVMRDRAALQAALAAVEAGAADFVDNSIESPDVLLARVRRHVSFARSQRLHVHLIAALYRRLRARNPELATQMVAMLPQGERRYLDTLPVPEPLATSADLAEVFDSPPNEAPLPRAALVPREGRLAELGQTAAELVHEIRQPLLGIKAQAQLLASSPDSAARDRGAAILSYEARIESYVERVAAQVRGEAAASAVTRCELREVVLTAVELSQVGIADNVGVDILKADPVAFMADRMNVEQIIVNLIGNAKAALRGIGGRISVTAGLVGPRIEIVVQDDGPGISPEVRARIFEPFITTKTDGTGLGLALSRRLALAAGGTLSLLESARGAKFCLRLPVTL